MGASYSAPTLKSQLKMAVQRLAMHRNKKSNQISIDSKQIAILLQQGKDESARIRCESVLHEKNLASAMELLQLTAELVLARVALITAAKTCPNDLEEGIASLIYCASRVEIPELRVIAQQFGAKFGKAWVETHVDNQSGKVHPRIQEKLSIQAPPFSVSGKAALSERTGADRCFPFLLSLISLSICPWHACRFFSTCCTRSPPPTKSSGARTSRR
jgi:vacuolar protein sorting-associated protein IST1